MDAKGDYLEELILNRIFRTDPGTIRPAGGVWVALFTGDPTDAGTGQEVVGTGYLRFNVASADANWADPAGTSLVSNSAAITYAVAGGAWGTIGWVGIFDSNVTGNLLYHGALANTKVIDNGDQFEFAIGGLTVAEG